MNGEGDNLFPPIPLGERMARLEQVVRDVKDRFVERLGFIDEKIDREVQDLRYDFSRMEAHQEEILRTMGNNKRDLSDQIGAFAGLLRDQNTRKTLLQSIWGVLVYVIGWAIALIVGFWGAHSFHVT